VSREKYTRPVPGGRGLWWTDRLWTLAADLPVVRVKIADIAEFDQDCWFQDRHVPTVRKVAEHARRILEADLAHPVILCAEGRLMDGGHRLSKAWMEGREAIDAVRFAITPDPDEILPA
jgi:hypothetical protein